MPAPLLFGALAAGGAFSILQGVLAAKAARETNQALDSAAQTATAQALTRIGLLSNSASWQRDAVAANAEIDRVKLARASAETRGLIRAASAESGASMAGSWRRRIQESDWETLFNRNAMERGVSRSLSSIDYNLAANLLEQEQSLTNTLTRYSGAKVDPFMQGLGAAIGGAQTGLSFASGLNSVVSNP